MIEKLKAELDLTKTLAQQSNQDHLNARLDYQGEIIGLKAERDELAAHLTQTQQELFLTKGSLMVRDRQLEEANKQLAKLQDTLNETEAYCKRKDITIDLLKQRLETMYE